MLNSLMVIAQFLTAASIFSYIAESIWENFLMHFLENLVRENQLVLFKTECSQLCI